MPLAIVEGQITDYYQSSTGIYLRVKAQEKFSLWLYTFANNEINKISDLNEKLSLWDVEANNRFMLTSSHKSTKDLLLLTLKYKN